MSIESIAVTALLKALKKAWKRDRDHLLVLKQRWQLLELREPVPSDFECQDFTIIDSVIVLHPERRIADGATWAPDKMGSNDARPGSIAHDYLYEHLEELAQAFGWTIEKTRRWADNIFWDINRRHAKPWFAQLYLDGVRKFGMLGHLYGKIKKLLGCILLAGVISGCATPVPMFVDGELEDPVYERIDK